MKERDTVMYQHLSSIIESVNSTISELGTAPDAELEKLIQNPDIMDKKWQEVIDSEKLQHVASETTTFIPLISLEPLDSEVTDDIDYTAADIGSGMQELVESAAESMSQPLNFSDIDSILAESPPISASLWDDNIREPLALGELSILLGMLLLICGVITLTIRKQGSAATHYRAGTN